jgi:hypothetical protein
MNEALRKLVIKQITPFLRENELVRHLFFALRGENPWVAALTTVVRRARLIVATDEAILLLSSPNLSGQRELIARLSRATKLGEPLFTRWALLFWPLLSFRWIRVNNERLWVATRDIDEVRAVDAEGARAS